MFVLAQCRRMLFGFDMFTLYIKQQYVPIVSVCGKLCMYLFANYKMQSPYKLNSMKTCVLCYMS